MSTPSCGPGRPPIENEEETMTIYGYTNYRFYVNNPWGRAVWFASRRERDEARAEAIESARAAGLADPESAFAPISRRIRTDAGREWLISLEYGRYENGNNARDEVWGAR